MSKILETKMRCKILSFLVAALAFLGQQTADASIILEAPSTIPMFTSLFPNYVGFTSPGSGGPSAEVDFINVLRAQIAGSGDVTIGGKKYNREGSTIASTALPEAVESLAVKDDSLNGEEVTPNVTFTLTGTYQYIYAKYDNEKAGSLVWFFEDGITGDIILPTLFSGHALSHGSAYNKVSDIPEPVSLVVWGVLVSAGICAGWRRRRRSA
ncbi:MAG: hypothetical protein IID44_22075 [Planctomycetes bacterium]|nr:hypothetical protein [Planctomycetota bacterium]